MLIKAQLFIYSCGCFSILFALWEIYRSSLLPETLSKQLFPYERQVESSPLVSFNSIKLNRNMGNQELFSYVHHSIQSGGLYFLSTFHGFSIICIICSTFLFFATSLWAYDSTEVGFSVSTFFVFGALYCILITYLCMFLGNFLNARATILLRESGYYYFFIKLFGGCRGSSFLLSSIGLLLLYGLFDINHLILSRYHQLTMEDITLSTGGFAFGFSVVSLLFRVGGGLFTNAVDISANILGKIVHDIPENDLRNPSGKD